MGDRVSLSLADHNTFPCFIYGKSKRATARGMLQSKEFQKKYMSKEKRERFEGKLKKLVTIEANKILGKILSRK